MWKLLDLQYWDGYLEHVRYRPQHLLIHPRQGCRHEVSTGVNRGERIQVCQNHLPPNSDFFSDSAHFISEILENLSFLVNIQKIFFKIHDFWGTPPQNSEPEGRIPHPPGGDAHDPMTYNTVKTIQGWVTILFYVVSAAI